jgi:hypothetical protein
MASKYSGADWVESNQKYDKNSKGMSPLGRKVADILGQAFLGIYHIDNDILRADLSTKNFISLTLPAYRDWSTVDGNLLTIMVVLCHDAGLRMSINPAGPRYFRFIFYQRSTHQGRWDSAIPTMEEHIAFIRDKLLIDEIKMVEEVPVESD